MKILYRLSQTNERHRASPIQFDREVRKLRLSDKPNPNPNPSNARASMLKATLSPKSGFTTSHSLVCSKHLEVTGNKSYIHTYSCRESETVALYTTKVTSCLTVQGNLAQPCLSQPPSEYTATDRIYTHTRIQPSQSCSGGTIHR